MLKAHIFQDGELVAVVMMEHRGFPDSSEGYFGEVEARIYGQGFKFQAQAIKREGKDGNERP